jgi:hypothetical protein
VLVPCAHDADDHASARPAIVIITARYFFIFHSRVRAPAFAAEFDDLGADKRRLFGRQERGRQVPAIVAASAAMRVVQDP